MLEIENITKVIKSGVDLNADQCALAAESLASADVSLDAKRDFLLSLSRKGESAGEVAAFANAFRGYAIDPQVSAWADKAIDVCGTGGDGSGTFNISTAVSFILAAAGVPVFKHGNRSITSKCGSADLMEALGIRLDAPHEMLRESLARFNFCFFFAPAFHPAFKEIMPVRKLLAASGERTIFNLLGPLINPGRPAHQLLGVYAERWVAPLANALGGLGLSAGLVVHGIPKDGMALDELSCAGQNVVSGFGRLNAVSGYLGPKLAGLSSCDFSELNGGDVTHNLTLMGTLLKGEIGNGVSQGLRDSILINAGAAFWAVGKSHDLSGGVELARETLASGVVAEWLSGISEFYKKN